MQLRISTLMSTVLSVAIICYSNETSQIQKQTLIICKAVLQTHLRKKNTNVLRVAYSLRSNSNNGIIVNGNICTIKAFHHSYKFFFKIVENCNKKGNSLRNTTLLNTLQ